MREREREREGERDPRVLHGVKIDKFLEFYFFFAP
jgi:hypothetical protein